MPPDTIWYSPAAANSAPVRTVGAGSGLGTKGDAECSLSEYSLRYVAYSKLLFIVSAYPAAGKSTALHLAMTRGVQLFGPEQHTAFVKALPSQSLDERSATREKLDARMWMTLADLPSLNTMAVQPERQILHLDLLLLLIDRLKPQRLSDLSAQAITATFNGFFAVPAIRSYARIAVNTILPPFHTVQANWARREGSEKIRKSSVLTIKHELITQIPQPEEFYQMVNKAWFVVAGKHADYNAVSYFDGRANDSRSRHIAGLTTKEKGPAVSRQPHSIFRR